MRGAANSTMGLCYTVSESSPKADNSHSLALIDFEMGARRGEEALRR